MRVAHSSRKTENPLRSAHGKYPAQIPRDEIILIPRYHPCSAATGHLYLPVSSTSSLTFSPEKTGNRTNGQHLCCDTQCAPTCAFPVTGENRRDLLAPEETDLLLHLCSVCFSGTISVKSFRARSQLTGFSVPSGNTALLPSTNLWNFCSLIRDPSSRTSTL